MAPEDGEDGEDGAGYRFRGRRKGKRLRKGRAGLIETLLPRLEIPEPGQGARLDPSSLFETAPRAIWLELGFGGGEHLAAQAAAHPEIGFIGCEPFLNGVASLLAHLQAGGIGNVRIFPNDALRLLPALADGCLDRLFILHPDPWPKTRHADRRIIGPANLPLFARLLKPGAELRSASDDPTFVRWALFHLTASPDFRWLARGPEDWRTPPADAVPTRYGLKALAEGRRPVHLRFTRV